MHLLVCQSCIYFFASYILVMFVTRIFDSLCECLNIWFSIRIVICRCRFLILLVSMLQLIFSIAEIIFWDKPSFRSLLWAFSRLKKCCSCKFCNTIRCMGKMFIFIILGLMADVIAISGRCLNHFVLLLTLGWCYCLIFGWCYCQLPWYWQMLLSPLRLMLLPCFGCFMAGVIAIYWQML